MRFFIFILIIANILMFAWVHQQEGAEAENEVRDTAALPSGIKPLQLLSETGTDSENRPDTTVTEPVPVSETAGEDAQAVTTETQMAKVELPESARPRPVCQSVGPFADQAVLYEGAAWLKRHGRQGVVRSAESRELRDYWVYVPSMPAEEADRIVSEFGEKGVKDYYRGRKNEISLGIYSREAVAERRRTQIAALGYTPVLEPRYRDRTVYWLDLSEPETDVLTDKEWAGFLVNHPDITRQPVSCP